MRSFFLSVFFFSFFNLSYAGVDSLSVKNLDLNYQRPYGKGEVEKASLGLSLYEGPYSVEVHRTDEALKLESPFFSLFWNNPMELFHNMESLDGKKMNLSIGRLHHTAHALHLTAGPEGQGEYKFDHVSMECKGSSLSPELQTRLMEDCRERMNLVAKKVDVPIDSILVDLLGQLPKGPLEMDVPADHLKLTSDNGDFSLVLYLKYYIYAGFRTWGHVSFEDNNKIMLIRVDKIKFGYLPVTQVVMSELKKRINHPSITVEPPYIKIEL